MNADKPDMAELPVLFLSHGSPMMALEDDSTSRFMRGLSAAFSQPSAIIVISAHWETDAPMITGSAYPETIHDFYGFPQALHDLCYPAPGQPVLAEELQRVLIDAGFQARIDPSRGFDHGVWSPLVLLYPAARIPVVEISVQPDQDARWHYRLGQALSVFREQNVLIIGTGNLTHNLREAMRGHHEITPDWVSEFAEWIAGAVEAGDIEALLNWQTLAPHAAKNHPTPEHLMPFFIALGAAGPGLRPRRLHKDVALGVLAMDAYAL